MTVSDLITLIALIIAIIAIINESDRQYIKIKFTNNNYIFLGFLFVIINLLLFNEWFYDNLLFVRNLYFVNFPKPTTWAYLISIGSIIWIIYKTFISKFPESRYDELKIYFEKLNSQHDYERILSLLEKYNMHEFANYNNGNKSNLNIYLIEELVIDKRFIRYVLKRHSVFINSITQNILKKDSKLINNYLEESINFDDSELNFELSRIILSENNDSGSSEIIDLFISNWTRIDYIQFSAAIEKRIICISIQLIKNRLLLINMFLDRIIFEKMNIDNFVKTKCQIHDKLIDNYYSNSEITKSIYNFNIEIIEKSISNPNNFNLAHCLAIDNIFKLYTLTKNNDYVSKFIDFNIDLENRIISNNQLLNYRNESFIRYLEGITDEQNGKKDFINEIYKLYNSKKISDESIFKTEVITKLSNY